MTTEEAIKKLENFAKHIEPNEEFIMAIKALEQTDGDLISRQAVLQKMWNDFYKMEDAHEKEQGVEYIVERRPFEQNGFECAIKTVSEFPSADKTIKSEGKNEDRTRI